MIEKVKYWIDIAEEDISVAKIFIIRFKPFKYRSPLS
jgi:hypothetical protein